MEDRVLILRLPKVCLYVPQKIKKYYKNRCVKKPLKSKKDFLGVRTKIVSLWHGVLKIMLPYFMGI